MDFSERVLPQSLLLSVQQPNTGEQRQKPNITRPDASQALLKARAFTNEAKQQGATSQISSIEIDSEESSDGLMIEMDVHVGVFDVKQPEVVDKAFLEEREIVEAEVSDELWTTGGMNRVILPVGRASDEADDDDEALLLLPDDHRLTGVVSHTDPNSNNPLVIELSDDGSDDDSDDGTVEHVNGNE